MPKRPSDGYSAYRERLGELPFVDDVTLSESDEDFGSPADSESEFANRTRKVVTLQLIDGDEVSFCTTSHLPTNLADFPSSGDSDQPSLLFMPTIGAELGDKLQALGIAFIDKDGNCNLPIGNRYLARVQRARPRTRTIAKRTAMRGPGYRVLYSLLVDWSLLGKSQRDIAAAAGTSKQPVADLLQALVHDGMAHKRGRTHVWATYTASREPGPNGELLDRWVAGYRESLRPKLLVGRFRLPPNPIPAQQLDGDPLDHYIERQLEGHGPFYFSGTAGGHRLVPYYRGPRTVVHLGSPNETLRRQLRAMPSPEGELVWLRHMSASAVASESASLPSHKTHSPWPAHTANPLLVYAELMSDPDPRAREAAGLVREEWLPWSL